MWRFAATPKYPASAGAHQRRHHHGGQLRIGTARHRRLFHALSKSPVRVHSALLKGVFWWRYRRPDPFGVQDSGSAGHRQRKKYEQLLQQVPSSNSISRNIDTDNVRPWIALIQ